MGEDTESYKKQLVDEVESTIVKIEKLFKEKPSSFFNEYCIVDEFSRIFKNSADFEQKDMNGKPISLITREYATPFKCSMKKLNFEVKPEDSDYIRGKYDIVLLNPEFVEKNDYFTIRNQDYRIFKKNVKLNMKNQPKPIVLYGLEFMFLRDQIGIAEPNYFNKTADDIIRGVLQDADKLKAGKDIAGFMENTKMLFYVNNNLPETNRYIEEKLKNRDDIKAIIA